MLRWIGTIPRVIRQHIHNQCPRASTGIAVEEDHDQCSNNADPKTESHQEKCLECTSSAQNQGNGSKQKAKSEEQRKTPHYDFWTLLHKPHSLLEAVGWGAAVVLGIQLTRPQLFHGNDVQNPGLGSGRRKCLLYQVAFALPNKNGTQTKNSVLDSDQKQHVDPDQPQPEENDPLAKVMLEFEKTCQKYTAMGRHYLGLQQAEKGDLIGAAQKWREASNLGYAKAQYNMGLCYETGQGVKQNLSEAVKFYSLAAEEGHPQALYNLAVLYLQGEGGVEKNPQLAISLLEQSAQHGLTEAQTYLGVYYSDEETKDMEKAVNFFRLAAQQNDAEGQFFLAICYEQGWGVEVNECKAADLYTQAAQGGHDGAMYNLGVFHQYGLGGLPVDRVSATELYQKAADLGHDNAKFKLDGIKAKAAVQEWKDDMTTTPSIPISKSGEQPSKLASSASSPTLTSYIREHLAELGTVKINSRSRIHMWLNQLQLSGPSSPGSSGDSGVAFSLGADEDDLESLHVLEQEEDLHTSPVLQNVSHHHCSMLQRNSTMPDLNIVACN